MCISVDGGLFRQCIASTLASSPVSNVHVTFRGATYDVHNVATVQDVQQQMKQTAKVSSDPTILFQGKKLEPSDILRQVGVEDGAQLQVEEEAESTTTTSSSTTTTNPTDPNFDMDALLKSMGVEKDQMEEFLKSMGASDDASGGKVPSMKESMEMMGNMMNSPIFEQFLNDPEKLEESRQMILSNPFLKQMMMSMPGMQQLLEDKDAWREAMHAAVSLYKTMDPAMLQAMMSGGGMGGPVGMSSSLSSGGLFDGTFDPKSTNLATASLDELDEGDD